MQTDATRIALYTLERELDMLDILNGFPRLAELKAAISRKSSRAEEVHELELPFLRSLSME